MGRLSKYLNNMQDTYGPVIVAYTLFFLGIGGFILVGYCFGRGVNDWRAFERGYEAGALEGLKTNCKLYE